MSILPPACRRTLNLFKILVDENTYQEIIAFQKGFQETTIRLKGLTDEVRVFSYRMHME